MKSKSNLWHVCIILCFALFSCSAPMSSLSDLENNAGRGTKISDWLKQNSIPIKYIEAGNSFSDLQPLKKTLQDAQVIGLGEATHGTHEFFTIKHRLLEFLVTEMDFTAFALESSFSD